MAVNVETWEFLRGVVEDTDLDDAMVIDAFNRFARQANIRLLDPSGTKHVLYPKGTLVTIQVTPKGESTPIPLLGGFVISTRRERDVTVLDILSHDFWLRRRQILRSYASKTISYILQDLITDYTPLIWDPSLVDVQNDVTITREWKGERLDEVILELSAQSEQEEYGATDARKFFFRPRSVTTAPRNFVDGEYIDAVFPREQASEANKVTVYYGVGGSAASVSVQDLVAQQALADAIGASSPVVLEVTRAYPEIDNEDAARNKARRILDERAGILIGTLLSWSAFDVNPGDVTYVEVPDEDVDGSYRIAELQYTMMKGLTRIRVAENVEGVADALVRISEEVTRVDLRDAVLTGIPTEVIEIPQAYRVEPTVYVFSFTVPDDAFIWGEYKGGWGDPDIGGGLLGDQRGPKVQVLP